MSTLVPKTKNNSSPRWKSRVYFCAHPDDHKGYLEQISNDIFSTHDCAIWHLEDPHGEIGLAEHFFALDEMQLFVVPVTKKLLETDNFALDKEIPFALENNKPVLPILMEEGIIELFNEKIGDIQLLDRCTKDNTADPYTDKLDKYLSRILLPDDTYNEVREKAFSSQIFLSYRKKDRRYAKDLMRLIHKNDLYRSVGIWYDEFLIPGENFHTEIREKIDESELFTLLVTPNLLEKGNYVHTQEYEIAKETKSIFAPEMKQTDRNKFSEMYGRVKHVTNSVDEGEFFHDLEKIYESISLSSKERTPENDFYLGVAYLNGINLEVDYDKAYSLIKSAAESNDDICADAIIQLIMMYESGNGVKRDYTKAFEWNCRLLDYYRKGIEEIKFVDETSLYQAIDLYFMVFISCLTAFDNIGDVAIMNSIEKLWNDNVEFLKGMPIRVRDLSVFLDVCSRSKSNKTDFNSKNGAYEIDFDLNFESEYMQKIMMGVAQRINAVAMVAELFSIYSMFCTKSQENTTKAKKYTDEALNMLEQYVETPIDKIHIAFAYVYMAQNYHMLYDLDTQSVAKLDKAYEHCMKVINSDDRFVQFEALGLASVISKMKTRLEIYGAKSQDEIKKLKTMMERSMSGDYETPFVDDDVIFKQNNAINAKMMGQLLDSQGQFAKARKYYNLALSEKKDVLELTGSFEHKRQQANLYVNFEGASYLGDKKLDKAADSIKKGIALYKEILQEKDALTIKRDLAYAYICLGMCIEKKTPLKAKKQYENSINILDELVNRETANDMRLRMKASFLIARIEAQSFKNDVESRKHLHKVIEIDEKLSCAIAHTDETKMIVKVTKHLLDLVN